MSPELLPPPGSGMSPMTPDSRRRPVKPHRQRQRWATGLTKSRAEALLDWLEAHGHSGCQVTYVAAEGFTVTE